MQNGTETIGTYHYNHIEIPRLCYLLKIAECMCPSCLISMEVSFQSVMYTHENSSRKNRHPD